MIDTHSDQEPLVSDAQISDALRSAISHQHYTTLYDARMVMQVFRDQYQARIRDLEAALLSAQAEIARGEMIIGMYERDEARR